MRGVLSLVTVLVLGIVPVVAAAPEAASPGVWRTISADQPSPRTEVVYNVNPFGGAVRQGAWKLVWRAALPSSTELFDLAADPLEQHDLAERQPEKVVQLRGRVETLARESVPPLLLNEALGVTMKTLFGSTSLPDEEVSAEP